MVPPMSLSQSAYLEPVRATTNCHVEWSEQLVESIKVLMIVSHADK